jgi:hypothetical protein
LKKLVCPQPFTLARPRLDARLALKISGLKMRCPNYKRGCKVQMLAGGEFQTLSHHLKVSFLPFFSPSFSSYSLFLYFGGVSFCFLSFFPCSVWFVVQRRSASLKCGTARTANSLSSARTFLRTKPPVLIAFSNALAV